LFQLTRIPPLFALAIASLAVGCGGGGSTLSKAEFIKQADAICEKADETELGEIGAYFRNHPKESKNVRPGAPPPALVQTVAVPSLLKETDDLEALGAPKGDEETIEAFISGIKAAIKEVEKDPESIEEDLPNGQGKNPSYAFREVNKLAREYGFKQCNEVV